MYNLKVSDMTCGHCVSTVEKAVKAVDASAQVKIDLATRKVEIASNKPAQSFVSALNEAGYTGELQA